MACVYTHILYTRYQILYTIGMSEWARRKKTYYGIGTIVFLLVLFGVPLYYALQETPTCFDGAQNQGETAVDKGGPCALLDERTLGSLTVLWTRVFEVREGGYNVVAYVDNPNPGAGAVNVPYQFKLYDDKNVLITERYGKTPIVPGKVFPVFEGGIVTANRKPARAFFTFLAPPIWQRMDNPAAGIVVRNETLKNESTAPRLEVEVQNQNVTERRDVVLIGTLFDDAGNAFASARTYVDKLQAGERTTVVFTWPFAFALKAARVDVVPLIFPALK